jgi:hypothetical protein
LGVGGWCCNFTYLIHPFDVVVVVTQVFIIHHPTMAKGYHQPETRLILAYNLNFQFGIGLFAGLQLGVLSGLALCSGYLRQTCR